MPKNEHEPIEARIGDYNHWLTPKWHTDKIVLWTGTCGIQWESHSGLSPLGFTDGHDCKPCLAAKRAAQGSGGAVGAGGVGASGERGEVGEG